LRHVPAGLPRRGSFGRLCMLPGAAPRRPQCRRASPCSHGAGRLLLCAARGLRPGAVHGCGSFYGSAWRGRAALWCRASLQRPEALQRPSLWGGLLRTQRATKIHRRTAVFCRVTKSTASLSSPRSAVQPVLEAASRGATGAPRARACGLAATHTPLAGEAVLSARCLAMVEPARSTEVSKGRRGSSASTTRLREGASMARCQLEARSQLGADHLQAWKLCYWRIGTPALSAARGHWLACKSS